MGEPLYHSPLGLFEFQAQAVARSYYEVDTFLVFSTGLGKTHIAMAEAALLFEDGLIEWVVVACEKSKLIDWCRDFETFTKLRVKKYAGTLKARAKIRDSLADPDGPQVIVGLYETLRNDLAIPGRTKRTAWTPGSLTETLVGRPGLVVWDEVTRLGNRGSGVHKAQDVLVTAARPEAKLWTLGLTGTPVETSPANAYNVGRVICPGRVGGVAQFESEHVRSYDIHGNPIGFKNIGVSSEPGVLSLREKFGSALQIKHKSDPDVRDQFPKRIEEYEYIEPSPLHLDFYATIEETIESQEWTPAERQVFFGLLRQVAGHPLALSYAKGKMAQAIWEQVGNEGLKAIGSAKVDYLMERLEQVCVQEGQKGIVFTFFGQSILPILAKEMGARGLRVVLNHGQMTPEDRQRSIDAIRTGNAQVFLSSDAGARGLNLPEATYVWHYELPTTHAKLVQRADRVHRIDSMAETVVSEGLILAGTIEEAVAGLVVRRNQWHDELTLDPRPEAEAEGEVEVEDDLALLTADARRALMDFRSKRPKKRPQGVPA